MKISYIGIISLTLFLCAISSSFALDSQSTRTSNNDTLQLDTPWLTPSSMLLIAKNDEKAAPKKEDAKADTSKASVETKKEDPKPNLDKKKEPLYPHERPQGVSRMGFGATIGVGSTLFTRIEDVNGVDYDHNNSFVNPTYGLDFSYIVMPFLEVKLSVLAFHSKFKFETQSHITATVGGGTVFNTVKMMNLSFPLVVKFRPFYFVKPKLSFIYVALGPVGYTTLLSNFFRGGEEITEVGYRNAIGAVGSMWISGEAQIGVDLALDRYMRVDISIGYEPGIMDINKKKMKLENVTKEDLRTETYDSNPIYNHNIWAKVGLNLSLNLFRDKNEDSTVSFIKPLEVE